MKINNVFLRILVVSASAILIVTLFLFIRDISSNKVWVNIQFPFLIYITIFNIASEGNVIIDRFFNKKMPWFTHARQRLVRQIPISLCWTLLVVSISILVVRHMVFNDSPDHIPRFAVFSFILGFIFLITFNGILLAVNFFKNWRTSYVEKEELQKEKLKSDYKLLQDQINPHFLFNSFNVLISEIDHDPKVAVEFTRRLSKVYRYVLQSKNQELVSLKDELNFIRAFAYLHQIRIGESMHFDINVDEALYTYYIPPLTLQILVENAIKHNVVNRENPLAIEISTENEFLVVKNNMNLKSAVDSTKTGLSNIKNRYKLLGNNNIEIVKTDTEFMVKVPLLTDFN